MARLSREEKRDQTRVLLRRSAVQAFASRGVGAASVDGITESAGFSRGAFYSNYDSKEDLLFELVNEMLERESNAWLRVIDEADDVESMFAGITRRFESNYRQADWGMLNTELSLHAERDPEFGEHYRRSLATHYEAIAPMYVALFAKAGKKPPADPRELAAASAAFGYAISLQSNQADRADGPSHTSSMFVLYLRGLIAIAEPLGRAAKAPPRLSAVPTKKSAKSSATSPAKAPAKTVLKGVAKTPAKKSSLSSRRKLEMA